MKNLIYEIKSFINNKLFCICIVLTSIASYGFAVTHESIGIDDLCMDRYVNGPWLLPQKRWGTWLFYNVLDIDRYSPFWLEFAVVILFIITALVMCASIKIIVKDKISNNAYIIGACAYISFPILMYQFTYQTSNLSVAVSNLLTIIAVYVLYKNYIEFNKKWIYAVCLIPIGIGVSMYESCLQTYIAYTFFILVLHIKYVDSKVKFRDIVYIGMIIAIELFASIVIYQLIGTLICIYIENTIGLPKNYAYTTTIFARSNRLKYISDVFKYFAIVRGNFISVFRWVIYLFIFANIYDAIKNKEWRVILLNIGLILANFIFVIFIDTLLWRSYYSWAITVGVTLIYSYDVLKDFAKSKYTEKVMCVLAVFLIIYQSKMTNQMLYDDYRTTQYTKNLYINKIANVIVENQIDYANKKIILTTRPGKDAADHIDMETVLWFNGAFEERGREFIKYLNHFGYNFVDGNEEDYQTFMNDYVKGIKKYNKYVAEGDKYIYVTIYE